MNEKDYGDEHERQMKEACRAAMFGQPCRCNKYRPKEWPAAGFENNAICDYFTKEEMKIGPRGGRKKVRTTVRLRNLATCPRGIHTVTAERGKSA